MKKSNLSTGYNLNTVKYTKSLKDHNSITDDDILSLEIHPSKLDDKSKLPKISYIIIVLNGMPFIEYALKCIYPFAQAYETYLHRVQPRYQDGNRKETGALPPCFHECRQ